MTATTLRQRRTRRLVGALFGAGFALASIGLGMTAAAADDTGPDGSGTGVTVTIPSRTASPTPTPTATPTPTSSSTAPAPAAVAPASRPSGGGSGRGNGGRTAPDAPACVPAEPAVPSAPASSGGTATTDKQLYLAGEQVTATATGFEAGEQVQLVLFSDPSLIGTFTADAGGQVQAVFPVAESTAVGSHTVQFTGWCKKVSLATVLVGASNAAAATGGLDVPPWLWWVIGGLAIVVAVLVFWQIVRVMRVPAATPGASAP